MSALLVSVSLLVITKHGVHSEIWSDQALSGVVGTSSQETARGPARRGEPLLCCTLSSIAHQRTLIFEPDTRPEQRCSSGHQRVPVVPLPTDSDIGKISRRQRQDEPNRAEPSRAVPCRAVPCRAVPRCARRATPSGNLLLQNPGLDPRPSDLASQTNSPPRKRALGLFSNPSPSFTLQDDKNKDGAIVLSFPPGESPVAIPREIIAIEAGVAVVSAFITGSIGRFSKLHATILWLHPNATAPVTRPVPFDTSTLVKRVCVVGITGIHAHITGTTPVVSKLHARILQLHPTTSVFAVASNCACTPQADLKDFPSKPKDGIGTDGARGPWWLYFGSLSLAQKFHDHTDGQMMFEFKDTQVVLQSKVVDLSIEDEDPGLNTTGSHNPANNRAAVHSSTLHVIVHVQNGKLYRIITPAMLATAFQAAEFYVVKANRGKIKVDGTSVKGTQGDTETIHFNIRPLHQAIFGAYYPPHITLVFKGKEIPVVYEIKSHPAIEGNLCLDGCHKYKECALGIFSTRGFRIPTEWCLCDSMDKWKKVSTNGAKELDRRVQEALDQRSAQAIECKFFDKGTCRWAKPGLDDKCKGLHIGDPSKILCNLKRNKVGTCVNGPSCLYFHGSPDELRRMTSTPPPTPLMTEEELLGQAGEAGPSAVHMDTDEGMLPFIRHRYRFACSGRIYCELDDWNACFTGDPSRQVRRLNVVFDSTKGYPGEGTHELCVVTYNMQGADDKKWAYVFNEAKRFRLDALLLQEHNIKPRDVALMQSRARRQGFTLTVTSSLSPTHRGGAAILTRNDSVAISGVCTDHKDPDNMGRVCAVNVEVAGCKARLVSAYGPVKPANRKCFQATLTKYLNRTSILGGDFNWVPDPDLDQESVHENSEHQNTHAAAGEQAIMQSNLEDTFRLVNGSRARQYTRITDTISRRLDRIYAQKYNSPWRWLTVSTDPLLFRRDPETSSDHLAVKANLELVQERPANKSERKINPAILKDPSVRQCITTMLTHFHPQHVANMGIQQGWAATKALVAEYLLDKSYERHSNSEEEELKIELKILYTAATSRKPNAIINSKISEAEKRLAEVRGKKKTSRYFAWISAQGEENSSKQFYRMFKRKWANSDLSSLHRTSDWHNAPEEKGDVVSSPEEIAEEAMLYYSYLFEHKPSINSGRMLKLLRKRKLSPAMRNRLEAPLAREEITKAIRLLGKRKAPGPDHLPGEFYIEFEHLVTDILFQVFEDIHESGHMDVDFRSGEIILLYKKGDPREIRNYRPITLLQVDYKIRSKILVNRLKPAMEDIIHRAQLGFVPGRSITDATHLLKLIQAYLDETEGEGLIIAADWEKAFDRVSWDYLSQALRELGFGPNACKWVNTMYNSEAPPQRVLKVNGTHSSPFSIKSGVPQGCPTSPLMFLLVAEALTRAIEEEHRIHGIKVHDTEIKITQFADDTQFLLSGYKNLKFVWPILEEYENATAMKANAKKFEGLRCGTLRNKPVPTIDALHTSTIQWAKPNNHVRVLGIPFWEGPDQDSFMETLYAKTKGLMAAWVDHAYLTLIGRNMIANAMVFSRFRYVCQTLAMPSHITAAIQSDVEALIWNHEANFDADEFGTDSNKRKWIKKEATLASRKLEGGAGVLSWPCHLRALQVKKLLEYMDATRGTWKDVLDHWFGRFEEGRGVVFSTTPIKLLTSSSSGIESRIPKFWKQAITALRDLDFKLKIPGHISCNGARAIPIWSNSLFSVPNLKTMRIWRDVLELRTVRDTLKEDGSEYSDNDIRAYIEHRLHTEGDNVKVARGQWTTVNALIKEWRRIIACIPEYIIKAARGAPSEWKYSLVSQAMMRNLGWTPGQGLGPTSSGRHEPVETPQGNQNREGLGLRRSRRRHTRKSSISAAMLGDSIIFVKSHGHTFERMELTARGHAKPTGKLVSVAKEELREPMWWGNGLCPQIEEAFFPNPKDWELGDINKPLHAIGVRDLTWSFTNRLSAPPTSKGKWEKLLGGLNWRTLLARYKPGLATPKDFGSHFKLILHRALLTNPHNPHADSHNCRLCGSTRESILHLGTCSWLKPVYEVMRKFDNGTQWDDARLNLFGVNEMKGILPEGASTLHFILWKHILIQMTLCSIKNITPNVQHIIDYAILRLEKRVSALQFEITCALCKAESRSTPPNLKSARRRLKGIGDVLDSGTVVLHPELVSLIHATRL